MSTQPKKKSTPHAKHKSPQAASPMAPKKNIFNPGKVIYEDADFVVALGSSEPLPLKGPKKRYEILMSLLALRWKNDCPDSWFVLPPSLELPFLKGLLEVSNLLKYEAVCDALKEVAYRQFNFTTPPASNTVVDNSFLEDRQRVRFGAVVYPLKAKALSGPPHEQDLDAPNLV